MENASKALIIAGEVLIAILVISFMVFMINAFGNFSKDMHESMVESQISEFNSNFIIFENRTNITASEIVTIINFAKQANDSRDLERNETSSEYYIRVYIDGKDVFNSPDYIDSDSDYYLDYNKILNSFIQKNNTTFFSCNAKLEKKGDEIKVNYDTYKNDVVINKNTALVQEIYFHTVDNKLSSVTSSF